MTQERWLACVAAALGVAVSSCTKEGPAEAHELPPQPGYGLPPPSVATASATTRVDGTPGEVGMHDGGDARVSTLRVAEGGDDGSGTCWEHIVQSHANAICGAVPRMPEPCATRKPPTPNVTAVVHLGTLAPSVVSPAVRAALPAIDRCGKGRSTARVTLAVDANGKVTAKSSGAGWLHDATCVTRALVAIDFGTGPDEITLDLTST